MAQQPITTGEDSHLALKQMEIVYQNPLPAAYP